jgi:hypothetical protein
MRRCVLQKSETEGLVDTPEFRRYFVTANGKRMSPWHDIPYREPGFAQGVYNFICEIPKG